MKNKNKLFEKLVSRTKIYLGIIAILFILLGIEDTNRIIPCILIYIVIVIYAIATNNKGKSQITQTLHDLSLTADNVAKTSLIHLPFPLIILQLDGNIIWKNTIFDKEFANVDIENYIKEMINDMKAKIENEDQGKEIQMQVEIGQKQYQIQGKMINTKNKENTVILYFTDETPYQTLKQEFQDAKTCVGILMIDNYEETMQQLETSERPQVIARIDKCIYDWTNQMEGILIKVDRATYVYLFEQRYLEGIKEDKFSILDKVKEIPTKENVQFTLSIAVSNEGQTQKEKYKSAETARDIVLGRGGDQAVIRENEIYKFFGGRTQEVERRTKVKARVVAQALEKLIKEANKVMIMGHKNPDIDSMGSGIGIYRLAKALNKNAYIIDSQENSNLQSFKQSLAKEEEYEDVLISKEVALENIDEDTLLVIVDTHKEGFVEEPELIKNTPKIVIIDHHRRSADFIEKATLTFQEVYASSAAELVTELLQHTEAKVELKTIEAESLYAGIMMDTKNFTFKTGVRTFEAAAYLRKCGVDIIRVKKWFQSDLESFGKIADTVKRAEIINKTIAISVYEEIEQDASLICAKAADELLTISDITASFVLGYLGDKICISGRSIGNINVQLILEKLGGGGHITLAGAQVEGKTMEEAKQDLINRINEYFVDSSK